MTSRYSLLVVQGQLTGMNKISAPVFYAGVFKHGRMCLVQESQLRWRLVDNSDRTYQIVRHQVMHQVSSDEAAP